VRDVLTATASAIDLGAPVADALETVRAQAGQGTWDVAVAALLLQREAGGDLVSLLRGLATGADLVARDAADARAASAQARLTARIVLVLPALAGVLMLLASPSIAGAMLTRPLPVALLTAAAILQLLALLAVRWISAERGA
jgi:tight adherence protein B